MAYNTITSAIGTVQSYINNMVLKNSSLGIENYTIVFNDYIKYRSLLLNLINILLEAFIKILGN